MNETIEILCMSDIHGNSRKAEEILKNEQYDISFFSGDSELSDSWINKHFNFAVRGNNDFLSSLDSVVEVTISDFKFVLTHGHEFGNYNTLMDYQKLRSAFLKYKNSDLIIYGHTHFPNYFESKENYPAFINPGSITYPRFGSTFSYVKAKIDIKNKLILSVEFKNF